MTLNLQARVPFAPGAPVLPSEGGKLRGILAIAGATIGMASGFGLLILASVFMRPLVADLDWSRSDVSLGYVCAAMGMAGGGLVWGRVSDKVDLRWMLGMGGAFQVLPLFWLSLADSYMQFLAAHFLLGFLGFGALYAPFVAVASEWFPQRRGMVMGIVTAGGAIGQGTLPYLANALIGALGWREAYLALALLLAAIQTTIVLTVRHRRPGSSSGAVPVQIAQRLPPRLLALGAAAFFCCACMGMPLVHLAGYVAMICGSPDLGATSLLVAMVSGAVGRLGFGLLADRIGNFPAYRVAAASQAACLVFFPVLSAAQPLLVLSAIFGLAFSGNMTCMLLCIREEAPPTALGAAIGYVLFSAWAGMGAGGYAGGAFFDTTGSYVLAFYAAAGSGLAAFALLSILDHAPNVLRRTEKVPAHR